jgi:hypothetical protein
MKSFEYTLGKIHVNVVCYGSDKDMVFRLTETNTQQVPQSDAYKPPADFGFIWLRDVGQTHPCWLASCTIKAHSSINHGMVEELLDYIQYHITHTDYSLPLRIEFCLVKKGITFDGEEGYLKWSHKLDFSG